MTSEKAVFGLQERVFREGKEIVDQRRWLVNVTADRFTPEFFVGFFGAMLDQVGSFYENVRMEAEHPDEMQTLAFDMNDGITIRLVPFRRYPDLDEILAELEERV